MFWLVDWSVEPTIIQPGVRCETNRFYWVCSCLVLASYTHTHLSSAFEIVNRYWLRAHSYTIHRRSIPNALVTLTLTADGARIHFFMYIPFVIRQVITINAHVSTHNGWNGATQSESWNQVGVVIVGPANFISSVYFVCFRSLAGNYFLDTNWRQKLLSNEWQ